MLYVIQRIDGYYFHNDGRIIIFESKDEAKNFIEMFIQYSMDELARQNRSMEIVKVPVIIKSECRIIPIDFDVYNVKCGVVYAHELFENHMKGTL